MIRAVLFDLDGTLLPMDQDVFVKTYFNGLCQKLAPYGYQPDALIRAIWASTAAMVKNPGDRTNEDAFWESFISLMGGNARSHESVFEDYYRNEFQQVRDVCGFQPAARQLIVKLKNKGLRVALATNPLFPAVATHSRIRWAGLEVSDFELVTTYENSCHCKPNTEYYRDILAKMDLEPSECLMVGNDAVEDMVAERLGMQVFLLTDCLIAAKDVDISSYPQGSFEELLANVDAL